VRRLLLPVLAAVLAAVALYLFVVRDEAVAPSILLPRPVAAIGVGSSAVSIGAGGEVLGWLPPPADESLPLLPASEPPRSGRVGGPILQQVRLLAAAPAELRPYLRSTSYGEDGTSIELRSGIELRFGDASQARAKWRAVAAVLADPSIEAVDYVDVQAPRRPAVGGSGHVLPPAQ
jgi:hypothetical protein